VDDEVVRVGVGLEVVAPELPGPRVEDGDVVPFLAAEPDATIPGDGGIARARVLPRHLPLANPDGVEWCGCGGAPRAAVEGGRGRGAFGRLEHERREGERGDGGRSEHDDLEREGIGRGWWPAGATVRSATGGNWRPGDRPFNLPHHPTGREAGMSAVRLFVYGSLRRNAQAAPHPLLADATFLGPATVPGTLY